MLTSHLFLKSDKQITMPGGWKTIESGQNRKPKWRKEQQMIEEDEHYDDEGVPVPPVPGARLVSDHSGYTPKPTSYNNGGGDDGFASRMDAFLTSDSTGVNTGRLMTSAEWSATNSSSKKGGGGSANVFKQLDQQKAAAKQNAAARAETAQKQKEARKAKQEAAERERARRDEAKEQARLRNTPSEWPVLNEALDANVAKIKANVASTIDSDPILSNGGVGAFFLYFPSMLERYTARTQIPDGVLTGERSLLEAVLEEGSESGAQEVMRYVSEDIIAQYGSMTWGTSDHNADAESAIVGGIVGLLSNAYGAKGSKIILTYEALEGLSGAPATHPASGTGAELAVQLAVSSVSPVVLDNLDAFLPIFFSEATNSQPAGFHSPASRTNFINFIRCAVVNAKTAASTADRTSRSYFASEERRLAMLARAAASLFISGALGELIKSSKGPAVEEVFQMLLEGVQFISGATRGDGKSSEAITTAARSAYNKLPWKNLAGDGSTSLATVKKAFSSLFAVFSADSKHANLSSSRFQLVSELVCRQHAGVAKAALVPLLESVDAAVSAQGSKFQASTSPQASLLFVCCIAFPSICVPAWRVVVCGKGSTASQCKYPHASLLLRKFLSQASVLSKEDQSKYFTSDFVQILDATAAELGSSVASVDVSSVAKKVKAAPVLAPMSATTTATKKSAAAASKAEGGSANKKVDEVTAGGFPWIMLFLGLIAAGVAAFYLNNHLQSRK